MLYRLVLISLATLVFPTLITAQEKPPNIIFILADDLGWTDLGCQGSEYYRTPEIDRMAGEGVRFTNGYSCGPNCQPTRAALMSGQYAPRTGVYTVGNIDRFNWRSQSLRPVDNVNQLNPDIATLGESMQQAGYATGYFGKWHLGEDAEHHPSAQGFDEAIVSAGRHFEFKTNPEVNVPEGTYLADFLTDHSIEFIKKHKEGPFYLQLAHFGVHSPYQAKEDLIAEFKDQPEAGGHHDPVYAAMIASVDESVGRVRKALQELGIADNTLVIFTSDNGGVGGYQREGIYRNKRDVTDNAPLRGGKGMLYEGGIRVPYIFNWPGGKLLPGGTVIERPINSVDLYPTLLELAGAPRPDQPTDGESYVAALRPGSESSSRSAPLYWHFPGFLGAGENEWRTKPVSVIRQGDWKLMEFYEDGHLELYNLADDPSEKHNLAETEADRAKEMHAALASWRDEIGAKVPTARKPDKQAASEKKPSGRKRGNKNRGNRKRGGKNRVPTAPE